jgi:predicted small lipoprotein YifL
MTYYSAALAFKPTWLSKNPRNSLNPSRMPKKTLVCRMVVFSFGLSLLAACGQKGPLFVAPQTVPYEFSKSVAPTAAPTDPNPNAAIAPKSAASAPQ